LSRWPGESGVRNNFIGDGMFNIDCEVMKDFSPGESQKVEFSRQMFNTTNSMRYDVCGAQPSLTSDSSRFGRYVGGLATPRFMRFAVRFSF